MQYFMQHRLLSPSRCAFQMGPLYALPIHPYYSPIYLNRPNIYYLDKKESVFDKSIFML